MSAFANLKGLRELALRRACMLGAALVACDAKRHRSALSCRSLSDEGLNDVRRRHRPMPDLAVGAAEHIFALKSTCGGCEHRLPCCSKRACAGRSRRCSAHERCRRSPCVCVCICGTASCAGADLAGARSPEYCVVGWFVLVLASYGRTSC